MKYLLCRLDFNEFYLGREQMDAADSDEGGDDDDDMEDDNDYGDQSDGNDDYG